VSAQHFEDGFAIASGRWCIKTGILFHAPLVVSPDLMVKAGMACFVSTVQ
jgi:hypothetical protein